jgi:hypothetical protein
VHAEGKPNCTGRRWTISGGSVWNEPIRHVTGPAASASSPGRRSAWRSDNLTRTGRLPWPSSSCSPGLPALDPVPLGSAQPGRAGRHRAPGLGHLGAVAGTDHPCTPARRLLRRIIDQVYVAPSDTSEKERAPATAVQVVQACSGHRLCWKPAPPNRQRPAPAATARFGRSREPGHQSRQSPLIKGR